MSDPSSTAHDVEGTIALAMLATFPLSALLGNALWNRGTTIDVAITTVLVISALVGLPVAGHTLRNWFGRRAKLDPPPHWNLKQDSPGTWVLVGVASAVLQVTFIAVAVYFLASVLAQHVGGSPSRVPAHVAEIEHFAYRKATCKTRVRFSWAWDQSMRACVVPGFGRALISQQLHTGDSVVLIIARNIFGSALVGIEPHAQQSAARDRAKSAAREQ